MSIIGLLVRIIELAAAIPSPENRSENCRDPSEIRSTKPHRDSFWNGRAKRIQFSQDRVVIDGKLMASHVQ